MWPPCTLPVVALQLHRAWQRLCLCDQQMGCTQHPMPSCAQQIRVCNMTYCEIHFPRPLSHSRGALFLPIVCLSAECKSIKKKYMVLFDLLQRADALQEALS